MRLCCGELLSCSVKVKENTCQGLRQDKSVLKDRVQLKTKRSPGSVERWDALKVTSIERHQILMTSEPLTGPPAHKPQAL
ncbi:hypothetical protein F2P81_016674 [Scophthalmus maximus]|uniref:Uncharacterized protein n=1 Tax=Scophthalmus maximus TaxID=52904 RepID=A0A6A4SHY5_SCOMX|nr:hypothetical protein F2P81_016674 [Scophthalmus maximus]